MLPPNLDFLRPQLLGLPAERLGGILAGNASRRHCLNDGVDAGTGFVLLQYVREHGLGAGRHLLSPALRPATSPVTGPDVKHHNPIMKKYCNFRNTPGGAPQPSWAGPEYRQACINKAAQAAARHGRKGCHRRSLGLKLVHEFVHGPCPARRQAIK